MEHPFAFGQVEVKAKEKIVEDIEWLSSNPVETSNEEFLSRTSGIILYQMMKYPDFPINYKVLSEFMSTSKDYKFYDQIIMIFAPNQLLNKIETGERYELSFSSLNSIDKVLEFYKLILRTDPSRRHATLDRYLNSTDKDLKDHLSRLLQE